MRVLAWSVVVAVLALGAIDPRTGHASRAVAGEALVERLSRDGSARVIVALRSRSARAGLLLRVGREDGFRPTARWDAVAAVPGIVTAEGMAALAGDPAVRRVDVDLGGRGADAESLRLVRGDVAHAAGATGAGVTVAVLDSGLDRAHPDLAPALVAEQCYVLPSGCPNGAASQSGAGSAADDNGHGTNVSGIVLARGTVAPIGVAPAASLVAIKVLDRSGAFRSTAQIVSALNWIALERPDVRVVNMSLATLRLYPGVCDNADAGTLALASAVSTLRARGVILFASAGNEASARSMGAPACLSGVIAVGAVYDEDVGPVGGSVCSDPSTSPDRIACFSNGGSQIDVLAPGVFVESAGLAETTSTYSGTSQASPHAAGAAALLLQRTPTLTPDAVESTLESTGVPLTDRRTGLTHRRLDIAAALGLAAPVVPAADVALSRRSLSFGAVRVGAQRTLPLLVANTGNATLTVRGASGRPFSVVSRQPLTVPSGELGILRIRFAPGAPRTFKGSLSLTTNDADERRLAVTLRGTGARRR